MNKKTTGKQSNNDRSKSLNPNNKAYKASMDNKSAQLDPKQTGEKKK
jgi:hypothetical protein